MSNLMIIRSSILDAYISSFPFYQFFKSSVIYLSTSYVLGWF